ncbi:MAG TPA: cytochrome c [Methylomirabilota bacterium]|jgi:mono/diheme cytochrome c family protein|nr:cytochrome c [Methylomirabilota bacterium]
MLRPFTVRLEALIGAILAGALVVSAPASPSAQPPPGLDLVTRGRYVFAAAGGCGCHTEKGKPVNSGGRRYDGPFGTVYSANITPDRQTGIGGWTDEQIITAIRLGRRPNGERLVPVHPYPVFNGMAEEDLRALVAFLRSLPAVNRPTPPKRITVPLFETVFLPGWLAAFAPRETPPPTAPTAGLARGEYLVRAVSHCGECHTPRGVTQATDNARFLGGNQHGPENSTVPNITPDRETGLTWSEEEIAEYLATGNKPDGDVAGGLMAEVIEGTAAGYKDLSQADRLAIARYLKSIPAVRNKITRRQQ